MNWFKGHKKDNILVFVTVIMLAMSVISCLWLISLSQKSAGKYLQKAQNSNIYRESLLNLELAYFLDQDDKVLLELTNKLLEGKNYALAEKYLRSNSSEIAIKGLAKAKYGLEKYAEAERISSSYMSDAELFDIYVKSLLKQGKTSQIRTLSEANGTDETIKLIDLAKGSDASMSITRRAMELKSASYPQAAFALLEEAFASGALDRDGCFMLGSGYYEAGNKDAAYSAYQQALLKDRYYPQVYQQLVRIAQELGRKSEAENYQKSLDALSW